MYLTRGFLNPVSRDVLRDLASPVEMHRTLLRAFPDGLGREARAQVGLLYRVDQGRDGGVMLVVQSRARPSFTNLPARYFLGVDDERFFTLGWSRNPVEQKLDPDSVKRGDKLLFRLRANATKKVGTKTGLDGKASNGRRIPLRGDEARYAWLARKAQAAGVLLLDARVREERTESGRRGDQAVTLAGVRFDGLLEVVDEIAFRTSWAEGIGPAKSYGFGLLSIAKAG